MPSFLAAGQQLNIGDQLTPPTGRTVLIMQDDGNLVLYRVDNGTALWSTNTWGKPVTHAVMQADGNFVLYDDNGKPYWDTGTAGDVGACLLVQDDGNVIIYAHTLSAIGQVWASNTVQSWPPMSAIENVSLVREQSSIIVYLIVGDTKFLIPDTAEFNRLGFDPGEVRTVVDGSLDRFTLQVPYAGPQVRPSDVFFDCGDTENAPPLFGTFYGNCKPSAAIVRRDILIAGWLGNDENYPFVNWAPVGAKDANGRTVTPGVEDIHYNITLDALFLDRMYGANGLSTALSSAVWPGNPFPGSPPGPVQIPFGTGAPLLPYGPPVVTFNSWILPENGPDVHGELNTWHVNDTNPNGFATVHWKGRGQPPTSWINQNWQKYPAWQNVQDNDTWYPFDPLDPEALGQPIQNSNYVLMRGTIWQENNHVTDPTPWNRAPTVGHGGVTEMHPPDWIVRVHEPNQNARLTTWRTALASQDVTGPSIPVNHTITPDFNPSTLGGSLHVRTVRQLIDPRFTNNSTVVNVGEQVFTDHVAVNVTVQPGGSNQARFKGAWLVGWSDIWDQDEAWVDDQTPAGATLFADNETWDWQPGNVFSGSLAHQSALKAGMHQHYFTGAQNPLVVSDPLDILFAMIFLDPDNSPDEVMLQWHTTDWSRAYWGANLLDWGTDGTNQRRYMGPLPPSGEWVRLVIPSLEVGIGATTPVDGMAFTLYNGRATWDYAGVNRPNLPPG